MFWSTTEAKPSAFPAMKTQAWQDTGAGTLFLPVTKCRTVLYTDDILTWRVDTCCSHRRYDSILALPAMQQSLDVLAVEGQRVHGPGDAQDVYLRHVKKYDRRLADRGAVLSDFVPPLTGLRRRYADGVAQSLVADAVRAGRGAHELLADGLES